MSIKSMRIDVRRMSPTAGSRARRAARCWLRSRAPPRPSRSSRPGGRAEPPAAPTAPRLKPPSTVPRPSPRQRSAAPASAEPSSTARYPSSRDPASKPKREPPWAASNGHEPEATPIPAKPKAPHRRPPTRTTAAILGDGDDPPSARPRHRHRSPTSSSRRPTRRCRRPGSPPRRPRSRPGPPSPTRRAAAPRGRGRAGPRRIRAADACHRRPSRACAPAAGPRRLPATGAGRRIGRGDTGTAQHSGRHPRPPPPIAGALSPSSSAGCRVGPAPLSPAVGSSASVGPWS